MTRDDTLRLMAVLKSAYPAYYREMRRSEAERIVDLWAEMLEPYPVELCLVAAKRLISESRFVPAISEIIQRVREYITPEDDNETIAWKALRRAAERATVMTTDEWEQLPHEVRSFVGSRSGLISLGNLDESTLDTVTRGQFLKAYPAMRRRREIAESMPPQIRALVDGLTAQIGRPGDAPKRELPSHGTSPQMPLKSPVSDFNSGSMNSRPTENNAAYAKITGVDATCDDVPADNAQNTTASIASILSAMLPTAAPPPPPAEIDYSAPVEPLDPAEWERLRDEKIALLASQLTVQKGA